MSSNQFAGEVLECVGHPHLANCPTYDFRRVQLTSCQPILPALPTLVSIMPSLAFPPPPDWSIKVLTKWAFSKEAPERSMQTLYSNKLGYN